MKSDTIKLIASYVIASFLIAGTYYALIIYPYALDSDVKLWLTGAAGGAIAFVFGDQVASRTQHSAQASFDKGLTATPNDQMPTVTATAGPPASVTVEAPEIVPEVPDDAQG